MRFERFIRKISLTAHRLGEILACGKDVRHEPNSSTTKKKQKTSKQ